MMRRDGDTAILVKPCILLYGKILLDVLALGACEWLTATTTPNLSKNICQTAWIIAILGFSNASWLGKPPSIRVIHYLITGEGTSNDYFLKVWLKWVEWLMRYFCPQTHKHRYELMMGEGNSPSVISQHSWLTCQIFIAVKKWASFSRLLLFCVCSRILLPFLVYLLSCQDQ